MRKKKRAVVFGIFDGIHEGHRALFRQSKEYGEELIVIVGRDSACMQWKRRTPVHSEGERLSLILQEKLADGVVLGDEKQSTYNVLKDLNPDVICVGYDQDALFGDLEQWVKKKNIQLVRLKPWHSEIYHNSKLRM